MSKRRDPPESWTERQRRNPGWLWWIAFLVILALIVWWCGGAWGWQWWHETHAPAQQRAQPAPGGSMPAR